MTTCRYLESLRSGSRSLYERSEFWAFPTVPPKPTKRQARKLAENALGYLCNARFRRPALLTWSTPMYAEWFRFVIHIYDEYQRLQKIAGGKP
jgi:hypothetical protein